MKDHHTQTQILSAIALRYKEDDLPRVIAKGKGVAAEKVLDIANQHQIPIHQDALLNKALGALELNQTIPKELFAAVAQVLIFAYNLNANKPK